MSSSISGNDITFDWTKPVNGNYFQAFNSSGSYLRYSGLGTVTTAWNQPYGTQQCAKARGAYNSRLAGWGYWSGFGNTSCRTPVIPVPAAPTGLGSGSKGWQVCDSGTIRTTLFTKSATVSYATGYHAQFLRLNSVGGFTQGPYALAHDTSWNFFGGTTGASDWVKVQFNASNSSGTSAWGPWIALPEVTGLC